MISFVVDAQLPPGLVAHLKTRGFAAEHVNYIGLGTSSDIAIWDHVCSHRAVLITKDQDFVTLVDEARSGSQIVWIRVGNITNAGLWSAIEPVLDEIVKALEAGERIVEVI